jgi:hypothetical protein
MADRNTLTRTDYPGLAVRAISGEKNILIGEIINRTCCLTLVMPSRQLLGAMIR